jgi:ankyrin repeat protein
VELLLQREANTNASNKGKWTALHYASFSGNIDMVRCLLEHKADMEIKSNAGDTCLDVARLCDQDAVAQLLLQTASARGLMAHFFACRSYVLRN